jgi:hypothetical protein
VIGKGCRVNKDYGEKHSRDDFKVSGGMTVRQGLQGRNKELRKGTGFVGERMSSVRDRSI